TFKSLHGGTSIELDSWLLRRGLLQADVEDILSAAGIAYSAIQGWDPWLTGIRTEGGVELLFSIPTDDSDEKGLSVISLSASTRKSLSCKQISITISEYDYDIIHKEAQRQKIGIAKLCSYWVSQKVRKIREQ
ncbi:MAG: hypothetical protein AB1489_43505, partial [Acidobacteriota bacterium]